MMPAAQVNFAIEQGTTWKEVLQIKRSEGGNVIVSDLTGYTVRLEILSSSAPTSDPDLVLSTENGKIAVNGPLGIITIKLSAAETSALNWVPSTSKTHRGKALYQLDLTNPQGDVERLTKGTITLDPELGG